MAGGWTCWGGVWPFRSGEGSNSHRKLSPEERQRAGIRDGLIRVSAGVEDVDDLIDDFASAMDATR